MKAATSWIVRCERDPLLKNEEDPCADVLEIVSSGWKGGLVITMADYLCMKAAFQCISMWRMTPGIVCHPLWRRFSRKSGKAPQKTKWNRMKASQGMDLYALKARQMGAPTTQGNSTRTSLNLTPFFFNCLDKKNPHERGMAAKNNGTSILNMSLRQ